MGVKGESGDERGESGKRGGVRCRELGGRGERERVGSVCGVSGRELERGRGERDWSERRECV